MLEYARIVSQRLCVRITFMTEYSHFPKSYLRRQARPSPSERAREVAELQPEWTRQVNAARELIAQFTGPHDKEIQRKIGERVGELMQDIVNKTSFEQFGVEEELKPFEIEAAKRALVVTFDRYLPSNVPFDIFPHKGRVPHEGIFGRRPGTPPRLFPRDVSTLIKNYGLTTGEKRSFSDIGREY